MLAIFAAMILTMEGRAKPAPPPLMIPAAPGEISAAVRQLSLERFDCFWAAAPSAWKAELVRGQADSPLLSQAELGDGLAIGAKICGIPLDVSHAAVLADLTGSKTQMVAAAAALESAHGISESAVLAAWQKLPSARRRSIADGIKQRRPALDEDRQAVLGIVKQLQASGPAAELIVVYLLAVAGFEPT